MLALRVLRSISPEIPLMAFLDKPAAESAADRPGRNALLKRELPKPTPDRRIVRRRSAITASVLRTGVAGAVVVVVPEVPVLVGVNRLPATHADGTAARDE